MSMMTVLDAVHWQVKRRWSTESEIQAWVYKITGKRISSGSNATARIRQLRSQGNIPITCRYHSRTADRRVYEYGICE